jgi:hypothetical protein
MSFHKEVIIVEIIDNMINKIESQLEFEIFNKEDTIDITKLDNKEDIPLNIFEESLIQDLEDKNQIGMEEIRNKIYLEDKLEKEILEDIEEKRIQEIPTITPQTQFQNPRLLRGYDTDSTCISNDTLTNRIVVSILCPPAGISVLYYTLENIFRQYFDEIYIFIDKETAKQIDQDIRERCKIIECPRYHPFNHIYYILSKEDDPQTIIVAMRSGYVYPDCIEKEIKKSFKRFPISAHCLSVMKFKSINFFDYITIHGNVGDIYENDYLIAYKRGFLKRDFIGYLDILLKNNSAIYSEEIVISNYFNKYKIPIRCIYKKKCNRGLIKKYFRYQSVHTPSGLNYNKINNYLQVVQLLDNSYNLYLRNSIRIHECMRCLSNNHYPYYRY